MILKKDLIIDGELEYVVALPVLSELGSEVESLREVASDDLLKFASNNNDNKTEVEISEKSTSTQAKLTKAQNDLVKHVQIIWQAVPDCFDEIKKEFPLEKIRLKEWVPPDKEIRAFRKRFDKAIDHYDEQIKKARAAASESQAKDVSPEKIDEKEDDNRTFHICFGERSTITENQKQLLDELIARESELAILLEEAFVGDYQIVSADVAHDYGVEIGKRPYLPELSDHAVIKKLYRIRKLFMAPESHCIGFEIETPWTTSEDGPYGLLLEDFEQTNFGLQQDAWCQEE
ncbi:hypothetical protein [Gimesia fumaroli]|uniref:Uncharacterized protein n=1 Tax=Gimesia fumaroli TaxID=2527976 RepID=A0A518I6J5_9PLAN|nr:hypothetical protein [Gimesia fumaroli]QDV48721.1 hypothetical protein Enr17x_07340 [Gimesia fumaroli]